MRNKRFAFLAAIAAIALSSSAFASDGTITFTGQVTAQTCAISGNGGTSNFTVALPTVSAGSLGVAGSTAGRTPFTIALSGCTPNTGTVHTFFEAGSTTDSASGRLNLTPAAAGSANASNVQIQLLNSDASGIAAGFADASQNSQTASISGGAATLNYSAQYYATGTATAGSANSRVTYTMAYQ